MSTDWPEGYDKIILDSVDSTMREAARRAPELTRPTWIMAYTQTAARGRQGRAWANPEGNFAATLVMRPEGSVAEAALRSFVAANALLDAFSHYTPPEELAQKWPNDVLLKGGKIAGILLESTGRASGGIEWLSIGVGANLRYAPEVADATFPPVSLFGETDKAVTPDAFLDTLASSFAEHEQRYIETGFSAIRTEWLSHAARLGEVITARTSREEITGTFEGIDAQGSLILRMADGPRAIAAADVYF